MKNLEKIIGGFILKNPALVLKLGLIMDDYKFSDKAKLWAEAESKVQSNCCPDHKFDPSTCFYEHNIREGKLIYSFRYYTPETNIESMGN